MGCDLTVFTVTDQGAIYLNANIKLSQCMFQNNKARYGGAIYGNASSIVWTIFQSTLSSNEAEAGGAIYVVGGASAVSFAYVNLTANLALEGGAFYGNYLQFLLILSSQSTYL